jgi:hypothetical protein
MEIMEQTLFFQLLPLLLVGMVVDKDKQVVQVAQVVGLVMDPMSFLDLILEMV